MAVTFVQHIVPTSSKTAGTTLAAPWTVSSTAGNVIVAYVVHDNASTTLEPVVTSISVPAGETASWAFIGAARSPGTTAGAASSGELWMIKTTIAWTTPTITTTWDTSITMRAVGFSEFSGVTATLSSTAGTRYQTGTTAASSATTNPLPAVGDLAIGWMFQSNSPTAPSGSTNTTGGSWSTPQLAGSTGGAASTNNAGGFQYKILTTASHQTYVNPAALTSGNGSVVATLAAAASAAPVASFTASPTTITAGGSVQFTDTSTNVPTSWSWNFGAGGPAGSTAQNPLVVFPTVGSYSVTLTATNGIGNNTSPATVITVRAPGTKVSTFSDTFDTQIDPAKWVTINSGAIWEAGQAKLACNTGGATSIVSTDVGYDFTESSIYVKITPTAIANGRELFLSLTSGLYNSDPTLDNGAHLMVTSTASLIQILLRTQFAGAYTDAGYPTYTLPQHTYLRLRHTGSTIYIDNSPDAITWTLGMLSAPVATRLSAVDLTSLRISICGDSWSAAGPAYGYFDNINSTGTVTGQPKVYNGSAWVKKPAKVWTGSAWVTKPMKVWTGSTWKVLN